MTPENRMKDLRSDATPTEAEWLDFRSTAHRSLARRRIAAVVGGLGLVVALVAGGYAVANMDTGDERGPGIAATPTASTTDEPSPQTSPSSDAKPEQPVQLWYVGKDDKLLLTYRSIESTESPERAALESLVSFIPAPLGETGARSAIPDGTEVQNFEIQNGTAFVALLVDDPSFDPSFSSKEEHDFAHAQVVYTLTQFPNVRSVVVSWERTDQEAGGTISKSLTRGSYDFLLPPIIVEEPFDGQRVGRTFELSGIANVFEANVSWRLTDPDGNVFKEGFVTATCGSGCWGTFEDRISLERVPGKTIFLEVFQASAEDGSPMDMVVISLNLDLQDGGS